MSGKVKGGGASRKNCSAETFIKQTSRKLFFTVKQDKGRTVSEDKVRESLDKAIHRIKSEEYVKNREKLTYENLKKDNKLKYVEILGLIWFSLIWFSLVCLVWLGFVWLGLSQFSLVWLDPEERKVHPIPCSTVEQTTTFCHFYSAESEYIPLLQTRVLDTFFPAVEFRRFEIFYVPKGNQKCAKTLLRWNFEIFKFPRPILFMETLLLWCV